MTAPPIVNGLTPAALVPYILAAVTAWIFWSRVVPRQLRGLQVAFETGNKRYEVHQVTSSTQDARDLLTSRGMYSGVATYIFALVGALLLFFEFIMIRLDLSEGYHAPSLSIALVFIALPALISSGTSLGAQIIKPIGQDRASLQESGIWRSYTYVMLMILWIGLVSALYLLLDVAGVDSSRRFSIAAFAMFAPSILAYGRILGSSWQALHQSSRKIAGGEPSPFHNHVPSAKQQAIAQIVNFNLLAMPYVALNTLISLFVLLYDPNMLVHTDRVLELPEYRVQTTFMEEGGLLGFGLIELFSFIPQDGIRVPIVSFVLLFLLMNVALIGFLFVYEVARILFLDVQDVSGKGGIKLADSRLLRAEPSQQAKVLNFCFTGFAGQSMLLLALAMITFWDSSFLPQGAACGKWENTVCSVMEKDALEELTWMLASGGQIAFLTIWIRSRRIGLKLEDITFDAAVGENRARLSEMQDIIYLKQKPFTDLIANDQWPKALDRLDKIYEGHGEQLEGLTLARKTDAMMELYAGLGRWNEAEQEAVSLLALRGGREAEVARLVLTAASLSQRDYAEAKPRLDLLNSDDIEAARLQWAASLFNPKHRILKPEFKALLSIDSVMKRNIELVQRFKDGIAQSKYKYLNTPPGRIFLLGDIARMRLEGTPDKALNLLEGFIKSFKISDWTHGEVVRALLHIDAGRINTGVKLAEKLASTHPRHPHVRNLIGELARAGHTEMLPSETTPIEWLNDSGLDWLDGWSRKHVVAPPPTFGKKPLIRHAWNSNGWTAFDGSGSLAGAIKKKSNGWKIIQQVWPDGLPMCIHTHLTGIVITISGMPVDLGFPGTLDLKTIEKKGLLES
ncbi:MAG: hypothetical protein HOL22_02800 [Euryarchaeota archaeon]|jgi:hypothetical protein|nr:hypothetical protein [Euryarchaeota archaeon]MBT6639978.1 hypothetical protein [Euryarchaeota archaeon]